MKNNKIIVTIISVVVLVLIIIGATYAYFSADVNLVNNTETHIKTNELALTFEGQTEINVSDIVPGNSFTKTFKVKNDTNTATTYNIYMEKITNEFNEDLVYTLTDDEGTVVAETTLLETTEGKSYLKLGIEIAGSGTHNYTLTIKYKYSDEDQNAYQGAEFKATVGIDAEIKRYILDGNLYDSEQNLVTEGSLVLYSQNPKYIEIASEGRNILSNLEGGSHEIYYLDKKIDINEYSKEKIINESVAQATFTTDDNEIILSNGYKMNIQIDEIDSFCESLKMQTISFKNINAEEKFLIICEGKYQLETWGAQGGIHSDTYYGGYGGYSTGIVELNKGNILYINVGGAGEFNTGTVVEGGYNGGGSATSSSGDKHGSGGGATHIAKVSGILSEL